MGLWAEEIQGNIDSILIYSRIAFRELEMKLGIILQLLGEISSGTLVSVSPGPELWGLQKSWWRIWSTSHVIRR